MASVQGTTQQDAAVPQQQRQRQRQQTSLQCVIDFLLALPGVDGLEERLFPEYLQAHDELLATINHTLASYQVCYFFKGRKERKKNYGLQARSAAEVCERDLLERYDLTLQHPNLPCVALYVPNGSQVTGGCGNPFRSLPIELAWIDPGDKRVVPKILDLELLTRAPVQQQHQQQRQQQPFTASIRLGFGAFLESLTPTEEEDRLTSQAVDFANAALHAAAPHGVGWCVKGAAQAAGSRGRKTHLRGSHDVDVVVVLNYDVQKGAKTCTRDCLAACQRQLLGDGWHRLPCKLSHQLRVHHPGRGLSMDLVPIPDASTLLTSLFSTAGLAPDTAQPPVQLTQPTPEQAAQQHQQQLLRLLLSAHGAQAAVVRSHARDIVNALNTSYMALWQRYSSQEESSGAVNSAARAFKAWVKHGLKGGGEYSSEAPFPGFVAEMLAMRAWKDCGGRKGSATQPLQLFLAMLATAARLLHPDSTEPLLLEEYYSRQQALSCKEDCWKSTPYIIHPVCPIYNISDEDRFLYWQEVAEAAKLLQEQMCREQEWAVLVEGSSLKGAVEAWRQQHGSGADGVGASSSSATIGMGQEPPTAAQPVVPNQGISSSGVVEQPAASFTRRLGRQVFGTWLFG